MYRYNLEKFNKKIIQLKKIKNKKIKNILNHNNYILISKLLIILINIHIKIIYKMELLNS
jgi:hypothetical protein